MKEQRRLGFANAWRSFWKLIGSRYFCDGHSDRWLCAEVLIRLRTGEFWLGALQPSREWPVGQKEKNHGVNKLGQYKIHCIFWLSQHMVGISIPFLGVNSQVPQDTWLVVGGQIMMIVMVMTMRVRSYLCMILFCLWNKLLLNKWDPWIPVVHRWYRFCYDHFYFNCRTKTFF